jgi:hypothetical protein
MYFHPVIKVRQGVLGGVIGNQLVEIRFTDILVRYDPEMGVDEVDPALRSN